MGAFIPGFLWLFILICLVQSPYLVYLRILPCVYMPLLAKVDSSEEECGKVDIAYYRVVALPFWPPRSLSVHV